MVTLNKNTTPQQVIYTFTLDGVSFIVSVKKLSGSLRYTVEYNIPPTHSEYRTWLDFCTWLESGQNVIDI